jgi:hypothetical protein
MAAGPREVLTSTGGEKATNQKIIPHVRFIINLLPSSKPEPKVDALIP